MDHRADDFEDRLAAAVPDGIDVYFENVVGRVRDAVLPQLNTYARVPVCGLVAGYNSTAPAEGPDRSGALMGRILTRSLTVRGFIQGEFAPEQTGDFCGTWAAGWPRARSATARTSWTGSGTRSGPSAAG